MAGALNIKAFVAPFAPSLAPIVGAPLLEEDTDTTGAAAGAVCAGALFDADEAMSP